MKIFLKLLNLILFFVALVIVIEKGFKFYNISKIKNVIIADLKKQKDLLSKSVNSCECINLKNNKTPKYIDIKNRYNTESNEEYWELKNQLDYIEYKLNYLSAYTFCGYEIPRLLKDQLSNKIYLGTNVDLHLPCVANALRINNKTLLLKKNKTYKTSMREAIEIELDIYTLNSMTGKIDTTKVIRNIKKNSIDKLRKSIPN